MADLNDVESKHITDRVTWLMWRKQTIGGSEAAMVLDMSPWGSPYSLWLEKSGNLPEKTGDMLDRGTDAEDMILKCLQRQEPTWKIRQPNRFFYSLSRRVSCTPDATAEIDGKRYILQCKLIGATKFKTWNDTPPDHYIIQAAHEAMVYGAAGAKLVVYPFSEFGRHRVHIYDVERNDEMEDHILRRVEWFWQNIQLGIGFEPNYAVDAELANKNAPHANEWAAPKIFDDDNRMGALLSQHRRLSAQAKEIEGELKSVKAEIIGKMEGAIKGRWRNTTISYQTVHKQEYIVKAQSYPMLRITHRDDE